MSALFVTACSHFSNRHLLSTTNDITQRTVKRKDPWLVVVSVLWVHDFAALLHSVSEDLGTKLCYLQVASDGYGVSYIISSEDLIFFHISSNKSSPATVRPWPNAFSYASDLSRILNASVNKFAEQWKICRRYSTATSVAPVAKAILNYRWLQQRLIYLLDWFFYFYFWLCKKEIFNVLLITPFSWK